MATPILTADRLRSLLRYDPDTGAFVWIRRSGPRCSMSSEAGSCHRGYRRIRIDGRAYMAHRLAFLYVTARWPSALVDHANGDGLDNRWENLREATRAQNARNSVKRKPLPKGVSRAGHGYRASVSPNGKKVSLGTFDTPQEAAKAYAEAATKHYGQFARW